MLFNRKPVPLLSRGPDPKRCYAHDRNRWSVVEGIGKDDFLVRVFTKKGRGRAEILSASLIPVVGCVLLLLVCGLGFTWNKDWAINYFVATLFVGLGLAALLAVLLCSEVNYFNQVSSTPLTVYCNGEFSVGDDKCRIELSSGSFLRYTLHYPDDGTHGSNTRSELDLVLKDGADIVAVYPVMAHCGNGCWRHAKQISKLCSIPMKRIALQANGKPFPPPLPN